MQTQQFLGPCILVATTKCNVRDSYRGDGGGGGGSTSDGGGSDRGGSEWGGSEWGGRKEQEISLLLSCRIINDSK